MRVIGQLRDLARRHPVYELLWVGICGFTVSTSYHGGSLLWYSINLFCLGMLTQQLGDKVCECYFQKGNV